MGRAAYVLILLLSACDAWLRRPSLVRVVLPSSLLFSSLAWSAGGTSNLDQSPGRLGRPVPVLSACNTTLAPVDTVFRCDFDTFGSECNDWSSEGLWASGAPTPPPTPHSGTACAGTNLTGNYSNNANYRFISPPISLPVLYPCQALTLRFWHWFSTESCCDRGVVQVRTLPGGTWQDVSNTYQGESVVWSSPAVDLSAFAGSLIQIAYRFTSDYSVNARGWYVDDVLVTRGPLWFSGEWPGWETFEAGLGNWWVSGGMWETGAPTTGPGRAHTGNACAATVLSGNYANNANTLLISPPVRLDSLPCLPSLRFWQSYSTESCCDRVSVLVASLGGSGWGGWTTISGPFSGTSVEWTQQVIELIAYAGQTVRFGFLLTSDYSTTSSGLYIDDVQVKCGHDTATDTPSPLPKLVTLEPCAPNPFNPMTQIRFSLPDPGLVDLAIFDIGGRRVRTLVSGRVSAGVHRAIWDGRNDASRSVASGTYFCQLLAAGQRFSTRLVLIR